MKLRGNLILFSILFCVIDMITAFATASTTSLQTSLSLQECIKMTMENNLSIKSAEAEYKSIKELEGVASSGNLPEVSASISATRSYSELSSPLVQNNISGVLSVSQNLFSGFLDENKIKEARVKTLIAKINLKQVKIKISSDLKQAYYQYQYAFELTKLSKKILDRRKDNLKNVELMFSSGRENKGSFLVSEAYFQQAQFELKQTEVMLKNSQSSLYSVIGLAEPEEILPPDPLLLVPVVLEKPQFKELAKASLEYQLSQQQEEAARIVIEKAKSAYYPSLVLSGNTGKYDENFPLNYNKWFLGLSLTVPLYSGGRDSAQYHSSLEQWKSEQIKTRNKENELVTKLKSTFSKYELSIEKYKVDEKFEFAGKMRSEIGKQKYNNGLMKFEDWNTIENDLILREKTTLSSKNDILVSEVNWEKEKGVGVFE